MNFTKLIYHDHPTLATSFYHVPSNMSKQNKTEACPRPCLSLTRGFIHISQKLFFKIGCHNRFAEKVPLSLMTMLITKK